MDGENTWSSGRVVQENVTTTPDVQPTPWTSHPLAPTAQGKKSTPGLEKVLATKNSCTEKSTVLKTSNEKVECKSSCSEKNKCKSNCNEKVESRSSCNEKSECKNSNNKEKIGCMNSNNKEKIGSKNSSNEKVESKNNYTEKKESSNNCKKVPPGGAIVQPSLSEEAGTEGGDYPGQALLRQTSHKHVLNTDLVLDDVVNV